MNQEPKNRKLNRVENTVKFRENNFGKKKAAILELPQLFKLQNLG
jgi:hypothetical protein